MENKPKVFDLTPSKLYQSLIKIEERFINKFEESSEKGDTLQVINSDLRELVALFKDHHDKVLNVMLIHGWYVCSVQIYAEKLKAFSIGETGRTLTADQLKALQDVILGIERTNGLHVNMPPKDYDISKIHEYLFKNI